MLEHTNFVSHAHEQIATLRTIDSYLADELIEALDVELFAHGADAAVPGAHAFQFFIKIFA